MVLLYPWIFITIVTIVKKVEKKMREDLNTGPLGNLCQELVGTGNHWRFIMEFPIRCFLINTLKTRV